MDAVPQSECASGKWFKDTPCDDPGVTEICRQNAGIPTLSQWGLVILALLLLAGGKVYFGRRRAQMV